MTLRNLKVFATVCQYMNMSRAARVLFLSPPAVSQIVKELENYFGTPLFLRQGHQLYLTHAGTTLYQASVPLLKDAEQLEESMRRETAKPTVNLGSTMTVSATFLPPMVAGYVRDRGEVTIHTFASISKTLEAMLLKGSLDFAIIAGSLNGEQFQIIPFLDDEQVFIAHKDHPLLQGYEGDCPTIHPDPAKEINIFVRDKESNTYAQICASLQNAGIPYKVCGVISNIDGIILSVAYSLGIGSVSKYVKIQNPDIRRFHIQGVNVTRKFNLVYLKDRILPPSYEGLKDYILTFPVKDGSESYDRG